MPLKMGAGLPIDEPPAEVLELAQFMGVRMLQRGWVPPGEAWVFWRDHDGAQRATRIVLEPPEQS